MALGQCRECGKQVSTEAASCPHCGVPQPTRLTAPAPASPIAAGTGFRRPGPSAASQASATPQDSTDSNILQGERVLYRARLHWITLLAAPATLFLLAILSLRAGESGVALFFILLIVAGALELIAYLRYSTTEFTLTDRRVLAKVGWISHRSIELLLTKVESVAVEQGIAGRMLGYGTVVVIGSGGTREPFKGIAGPMEFRKRVLAQTPSATISTS